MPVGQDRLKLWHLPSDLDPIAIRRSQPTEEERAGLALACSKPCSGFP